MITHYRHCLGRTHHEQLLDGVEQNQLVVGEWRHQPDYQYLERSSFICTAASSVALFSAASAAARAFARLARLRRREGLWRGPC